LTFLEQFPAVRYIFFRAQKGRSKKDAATIMAMVFGLKM